ncbi:HIT family protein [Gammaproteobacteria bacterium]|nr:HIT family protein [Gammaproteobacteria bacterium]
MSLRDCIFCESEILNGPNCVYDYRDWALILNQYQFLPGVCMLVRKSHKEGLTSLSENEVLESHSILTSVEKALKKSFAPDWFNYLQTNNSVRHLHFHIIPRYKNPVRFAGEEFIDENFEGMPIERERTLSREMMDKIVHTLQSNIEMYEK